MPEAVVDHGARAERVGGRIGPGPAWARPGRGGELAHHHHILALRILGPGQVDRARREVGLRVAAWLPASLIALTVTVKLAPLPAADRSAQSALAALYQNAVPYSAP